MKMKLNPMSYFQRCTTLIQRDRPMLKQRLNVETTLHKVDTTLYNVDTMLYRRCFDVASMSVKTTSNPIGLVMIKDLYIE